MVASEGMWLYEVGEHVTIKTSVDADNELRASNTGEFPNSKTGSCRHRTGHELHAGVLKINRIVGQALTDTSWIT